MLSETPVIFVHDVLVWTFICTAAITVTQWSYRWLMRRGPKSADGSTSNE